MIFLPYSSYVQAIVKRKDYNFLFLDSRFKDLIIQNARLLKHQEQNKNIVYERFFDLIDDSKADLSNIDVDLEDIFVETENLNNSFYEERDFYAQLEKSIIVPSESFSGLGDRTNLSASRNIILDGIDFKGVGRTQAASRLDYKHSWGGMYFYEALIELVYSKLIEHSSRLGVENVIAIGIAKDELNISGSSKVILIRKRSSPRLVSCCKIFHTLSKKNVFSELISEYSYEALRALRVKLFSQYFSLSALGLVHESMILENLTLSGSILDLGSIQEKESYGYFYFRVHLNTEKKYDNLDDLFQSEVKVFKNSLFDLINSLFMTSLAFKFQEEYFSIDKKAEISDILEDIKSYVVEKDININIDCFIDLCSLMFDIPQGSSLSAAQKKRLLQLIETNFVEVEELDVISTNNMYKHALSLKINLGFYHEELIHKFNLSREKNIYKVVSQVTPLITQSLLPLEKIEQVICKSVVEYVKINPLEFEVMSLNEIKRKYGACAYKVFENEDNVTNIGKWLDINDLKTSTSKRIIYAIRKDSIESSITPVII